MAAAEREPIRLLVFAATLSANGGEVDLKAMADFDAPSYNFDVQGREGFPAGVEAMRDCISINDAFVIASPEYNASTAT